MDLLDIIEGLEPKVVGSNLVVASTDEVTTDLSPYISRYKVVGSKSSNLVLNKVLFIIYYRVKNAFLPTTPTTFCLNELCKYLDNHELSQDSEGSSLLTVPTAYESFVKEYLDYCIRYDAVPGDAWEGFGASDVAKSLTEIFKTEEARILQASDVLRAAEYERNRGAKSSTLALMYSNNVNSYVWFEDTTGGWHCYKQGG